MDNTAEKIEVEPVFEKAAANSTVDGAEVFELTEERAQVRRDLISIMNNSRCSEGLRSLILERLAGEN